MSTAKSILASSCQELGLPSQEANQAHWMTYTQMRKQELESELSRQSSSSSVGGKMNNFVFLINEQLILTNGDAESIMFK